MKRIFMVILSGAVLLSACGTKKEGIEVKDAWMRPAVQGENGAVYFSLHNDSSSVDELTGAESDAAEAVEFHESMMMDGDIMEMGTLSSVPLEPSAEITFEPGGLHIMLVGLKKDFKVGDRVEVILHFKNYEDIRVNVDVMEDSH